MPALILSTPVHAFTMFVTDLRKKVGTRFQKSATLVDESTLKFDEEATLEVVVRTSRRTCMLSLFKKMNEALYRVRTPGSWRMGMTYAPLLGLRFVT